MELGAAMALDTDAPALALESGGTEHGAGAGGDHNGEPKDEYEELPHRHPSYRNAQWLKKRPGAPNWTPKICRLLEGWMGADEAGSKSELGAMIDDLWKVMLDCDKSSKDALKGKIKEHKKKRQAKDHKQRKKEKKRDEKSKRSKGRGEKHKRESESDSSSSSEVCSDNDTGSSSSDDSNSSLVRSSKSRETANRQRSTNQPEF